MKKFLSLITVLTLGSGAGVSLATNAMINTVPTTSLAAYQDGIDKFEYKLLTSKLYLSNLSVWTIAMNESKEVAIATVLRDSVHMSSFFAGLISTILTTQWYLWNVESYNKGMGVCIEFATVTAIIDVWAQ